MLFIFCVTVAMTIKDMLANRQVMIEKLTLPFCTALVKMPIKIKKMKWADYLVGMYINLKFVVTFANDYLFHRR